MHLIVEHVDGMVAGRENLIFRVLQVHCIGLLTHDSREVENIALMLCALCHIHNTSMRHLYALLLLLLWLMLLLLTVG
jgi:hypothetical protein